MPRLQIEIDNEHHRVVYIDYRDGIPHQVHTIYYVSTAQKPYWRLCSWDFFPNDGNISDIRAYNCGSGGSHKKIQAPQWADGYIGKYWLADDARLKGKPKNAMRLKNPIPVKGYFGTKSINPFKISEITNSSEYCEECGHESTEFCDEHKYEDEKGNVRYKSNKSIAE